MNQLIWSMQGTVACLEEWRMNGDKSCLGQVDLICDYYGMLRVSSYQLDKKTIKRVIKAFIDEELWKECFSSSVVKERPYLGNRDKSYQKWDKSLAQALFAWRTGSLQFKSSRKIYNVKRGLGIHCVMPMCDGKIDNWEHLIECKFYDTKWNHEWSSEEEIAKFLVKISRERMIKVKMPLF